LERNKKKITNKRKTKWGAQATTATKLHLKMVVKKEEGVGGKLADG
jgi:hypothetical protein